MELFDIFSDLILRKNLNLNLKQVFNNEFSSKQLLTRQYIRKN